MYKHSVQTGRRRASIGIVHVHCGSPRQAGLSAAIDAYAAVESVVQIQATPSFLLLPDLSLVRVE